MFLYGQVNTELWKPCGFPLYTIYKDYFFVRLLNKHSVEETQCILPCCAVSSLEMQHALSRGCDLSNGRNFSRGDVPVCAAGNGPVPLMAEHAVPRAPAWVTVWEFEHKPTS